MLCSETSKAYWKRQTCFENWHSIGNFYTNNLLKKNYRCFFIEVLWQHFTSLMQIVQNYSKRKSVLKNQRSEDIKYCQNYVFGFIWSHKCQLVSVLFYYLDTLTWTLRCCCLKRRKFRRHIRCSSFLKHLGTRARELL